MLLIGGTTLLCGVWMVRDGMIMVFKAFVLGVVSAIERRGIQFAVRSKLRSRVSSMWILAAV